MRNKGTLELMNACLPSAMWAGDKEAGGRWRVAQELLQAEPVAKRITMPHCSNHAFS